MHNTESIGQIICVINKFHLPKILTHTEHSEKILDMRIFLIILILIFSLQSLTKAEDIRELEIEGISIGDSLLNYFNKNEIKKNFLYKSKKYYSFASSKYSSETYDGVQFHVRSDDDKYIIESIEGVKVIDNFNECKKLKKKIVDELSSFFNDAKIEDDSGNHIYDQTGDSKYTRTVFFLNPEYKWNSVQVACFDWSIKLEKKYADKLTVAIQTQNFQTFMVNEAYK